MQLLGRLKLFIADAFLAVENVKSAAFVLTYSIEQAGFHAGF